MRGSSGISLRSGTLSGALFLFCLFSPLWQFPAFLTAMVRNSLEVPSVSNQRRLVLRAHRAASPSQTIFFQPKKLPFESLRPWTRHFKNDPFPASSFPFLSIIRFSGSHGNWFSPPSLGLLSPATPKRLVLVGKSPIGARLFPLFFRLFAQ